MSGVFRNIDPPSPHRQASVYPPAFGAGGGTHSLGGEGVGVNSSVGRRQTLLCTLNMLVLCDPTSPASLAVTHILIIWKLTRARKSKRLF
jgi:hypothetical protein